MSGQPSGSGSASPSGTEDATTVATGPRALKAKLAWELTAQFDRRRQQRARDGEVAGAPSAPAQATAPFDTFSDAFDAFETELRTVPHALLARVLFAQFERSTHLPHVTPSEFCHVDRSDGLPLLAWVQATNDVGALERHALYVFFEWFIDSLPSAVDDNGHWTRSPDHVNPLPRAEDSDYKPRALRAMPTRYFLAACELLLENNFAWPSRRPDDQVTVQDSATGETRREWNPVRAGALLLKFLLPLPTNDLRFVESEETDVRHAIEDEDSRGVRRPRGFLQPMVAGSPTRLVGVRLPGGTLSPLRQRTPNPAPLQGCGYDVPLERPGVLALVNLLETYQRRFNPIAKPLAWADVIGSPFSHLPRPVQRRLGNACFLLRDVQHLQGPAHPVTLQRVNDLWLALLARLEEVLYLRGERGPDGEPIVFIRRWDTRTGAPLLAVYSLDSLRVSCIANLRQMGIVSPGLLAQLAGHEFRPRRRGHATCGLPPLRGNPYIEAMQRHEEALRLWALSKAELNREVTLVPPNPPPRPRFRP
jgi:hypothetical protein